jgi:hypothetical protein
VPSTKKRNKKIEERERERAQLYRVLCDNYVHYHHPYNRLDICSLAAVYLQAMLCYQLLTCVVHAVLLCSTSLCSASKVRMFLSQTLIFPEFGTFLLQQ